MPQYEVAIVTRIPITARNEDQAQERAQQLLEWLHYQPPAGRRWANHPAEHEVDYISETPE